jgi:hypothetical protein
MDSAGIIVRPADHFSVDNRHVSGVTERCFRLSFELYEKLLRRVAQRKTAFSASMAKNKPPKDQPNSRVVARSLIKQQRYG